MEVVLFLLSVVKKAIATGGVDGAVKSSYCTACMIPLPSSPEDPRVARII